ncbi:hypothetical protein FGG08_000410 [Glutinoglossum americanum]|uniref:Uncharacterized protein n=1 Tax=Glutinoglossum americanum TaxID=1670608 RepID=A0A9P8L647_9PEZI|nr:hypothetical protein FGG08_000410 [Glutinoglossum americanum]
MSYDYNNQYQTTSYGAQGGMGGGGFISQYGGSQGGSQNSPGSASKACLATNFCHILLHPLTAKQPHPDAEFKIDDVEVTQVSFIGQIRNISSQTTMTIYKMDDGTGTIEVKQYVDSDAASFMDTDGTSSKPRLVEGAYAKAWGRLRSSNNKRFVGTHVIRPIQDHNEVQCHLLEATAVHLYFTRGPPEQFTNTTADGVHQAPGAFKQESSSYNYNAGAGGMASNGKGLPQMSPVARRVYEALKSGPQNHEGVHVHQLVTQLGLPYPEVLKAGDELLGHGSIFTTVDDETNYLEMADADEDNPRAFQPNAGEVDLSDETVDWRILGVFSKSDHPTIPRRGEKDFEPDGTNHQDRILTESRRAMHDALSLERIQPPKSHIKAIWYEELRRASVTKLRGHHFQTVGKQESSGNLWLLPEETLWLLERGTISCWWESGLPMSLQGCYAACLSDESGLTLERLQVFTNLKRMGYTVMRAPSWDSEGVECEGRTAIQQSGLNMRVVGLFRSIFSFTFGPRVSSPSGPLVESGLWRSYNGIYRRLALIPYHNPTLASLESVSSKSTDPPFRIAYNVWKPRPGFKKSSPGEPDFRVAVVNARETSVPTLTQVSALLESVPYDPPPPGMQRHSYMRLKHGYRNAILAVVDQGVTSYLRLGDAGFGLEKMYGMAPKRGLGSKRGARTHGGNGRGRGDKARG